MGNDSKYYTLKGYQLADHTGITTAVEDYLEMIYRLVKEEEFVRIRLLAESLNVKPSSVSKMMDNLRNLNFISSEKYGYIKLTEEGIHLGKYLVYRHELLNHFLCFINNTEDEIEQVEKIEHYINEKTLENIQLFLNKYDGS